MKPKQEKKKSEQNVEIGINLINMAVI